MSTYFLSLEIARLRQQEMLKQAEAERLYQQLKENRPGLLRQTGRQLLAVARQFVAYLGARPGAVRARTGQAR